MASGTGKKKVKQSARSSILLLFPRVSTTQGYQSHNPKKKIKYLKQQKYRIWCVGRGENGTYNNVHVP